MPLGALGRVARLLLLQNRTLVSPVRLRPKDFPGSDGRPGAAGDVALRPIAPFAHLAVDH